MTRFSRHCPECLRYGNHASGCPNNPPPIPVMQCDICRADIFETDIYYDINDTIYCVDCMADEMKVAWKEDRR